MRALTTASLEFSNDINRRRPNIVQFCDSQSLVKSIEGRLQDCKKTRNSATRVWWPQISAMLRWGRNGGAKWVVNWRRGHIERRVPEGKNWAPADWGNVIADVVAGRGWKAGAVLGLEDNAWPAAVQIPGGRWRCRLRDAYVHDVARHCFSSTGEEQWHEIHGPMNKSMRDASATRAGNVYVARRLGERQVEGASGRKFGITGLTRGGGARARSLKRCGS